MPHKTIEIDTGKMKRAFPQLKSDVINTLTFGRIDLEELDATYFHVAVLIVGLGIANYVAYVIGTLLRLKIVSVLLSILFPLTPLMGFFYLFVYSYIAASVYVFMLSDEDGNFKNYMYVVLLASVHLPFAIIIVNFAEGIIKIFSWSLFDIIFFGCFGLLALFSDYFCHKNLTRGRHFENKSQKVNFILVSLILNFGAYLVIFPLLYAH